MAVCQWLMPRLTECATTSPARHNDTGTDPDTAEGAAETGSEGDGGDHVELYLAEYQCYVETGLRQLRACRWPEKPATRSHTVPLAGYGAGRGPGLVSGPLAAEPLAAAGACLAVQWPSGL